MSSPAMSIVRTTNKHAGLFASAISKELEASRQPRYRIGFLHRPGLRMNDHRLATLVSELRGVARTCFDEVPSYQCLSGIREELSQNVITVARRKDGSIAGFCSAILLPVEGVGSVLHLGLTCVDPDDRGSGLTHKLTSALVLQYLLRRAPLGRVWITNLACVLSSLGNVAMHFEGVFPSPFSSSTPSPTHLRIAEEIDRHHRVRMFVGPEAVLDPNTFVFRRSAAETVFQKSPEDGRFHHRDPRVNEFYRRHMDMRSGDEVLQVGWVSLLAYPAYMLRRQWRPQPQLASA